MEKNITFTEGNIARPLIRFALPVFLAIFLQSLYGAVDLLVVGQFGTAAVDYLKSYAIDTLVVSFLFCYIGYFNGCGKTTFVMIQGIAGAFGVRIPLSYLISKTTDPTLFKIGLATPASTVVQIVLCTLFFVWLLKKERKKETT